MFKKIIAYSFILVAGLIALAHDIVVHHHHEVDAIEQHQAIPGQAEDDHHHHHFPEHEHQQGDYYLVNRQSVVLSPDLYRILGKDLDPSGDNGIDGFFINSPAFYYVHSPPGFKIPDRKENWFIPKTVNYTFGLRAPPFV